MKKKSFAIIGGGLTGCASALYLKDKGYDVTIYEKDNELGGITKDLKFHNQIYFNGPNYLNPESLLIQLIKEKNFFNNNILTKNISYGSYTDIFGKKTFDSDFAHPISFEKFKTKISLKIKPNNLLERIQHYPKKTSKDLINWCSRFENELIKLHPECSHSLGIGRVFFKNSEKELLIAKKKSNFYDNLLGIPNLNKLNTKFCIPKNGYDLFFQNLKKFLEEKHIKIILSSKILIQKEKDRIFFNASKKTIIADYFIWACNPVPLLVSLNIGKLDNPIIKTKILSCDLDENSKKVHNRYIQVFSKNSNIFRIYIYNLKKKNKLTVELMLNKKNNDIKKELKYSLNILSKFGYKFDTKNPIHETRQIRHILFTADDYKKFMKFEKISKNINIISGGWYLTGSQAKMNHIKKTIEKLNL